MTFKGTAKIPSVRYVEGPQISKNKTRFRYWNPLGMSMDIF